MGFLGKLFGSSKQGQTASSAERKVQRGTFQFEMPLIESDAEYKIFAYDEANVYYNFSALGDRVIGTYQKQNNGQHEVDCFNAKGGRTGFVYLDQITLSRETIYENFKNVKLDNIEILGEEYEMVPRMPAPLYDVIARIEDYGGSGEIIDTVTGDVIGKYVGDKYGAAAAFIAATDELHSKTKYAKWMVDWEKLDRVKVER